MKKWNQSEAIALCKKIEAICQKYGCHVALTGGLLYGDGERKDLDIVFYRIRQVEKIDVDGLFIALEKVDIVYESGFGFVRKATYQGEGMIDCFFPEAETDGEPYPPKDAPFSEDVLRAEQVAIGGLPE